MDEPPVPRVRDDPFGLVEEVTWGDVYPARPPETLEITDRSAEYVEFAVWGNGCDPVVVVDVLADAPAPRLRVSVTDWVPQELQCTDILTSYPVTVTFARSVDPEQITVELNDQRVLR